MIVLRVEHPVTGRGMYSTNPATGWCYVGDAGLPTTGSDRHPMPYDDSLFSRNDDMARMAHTYDTGDYVFGFEDMTQLTSWLYNDASRAALQEFGLVLNMYDVPNHLVVRGFTQLTFHKNLATHVGRLDLVTLEKQQ